MDLTRRTRRNLSDPRIKRIVKKQIFSSQNPIAFAINSPIHILFKRALLSVAVIIVLLWGYSLMQDSEVLTFSSLIESITGAENPVDKAGDENTDAAGSEKIETAASETSEEKTAIAEAVTRKLQVEVLNGCGAGGIAAKVTQYLRDNDIDVVKMGNHSSYDIKRTVLWDRTDKNQPSRKIAELLGLRDDRITEKIDPNLQLDVTIILGADYNTLIPFKN